MHEALHYEKKEKQQVKCQLCNHGCLISKGEKGICGVRENRKGKLYALTYGKAIAVNVDPIEKKPLFHFLPGTKAFSVATIGCNFACKFCQNYDISQISKSGGNILGDDLSPEDLVKMAEAEKCKTIAYTYTEPTIFYEYALNTMKLAVERGIKNIWVSNGFMNKKIIHEMKGLLHGVNVDLKAYKEDFYQELCGAKLAPVKENLREFKKQGIWLEVTTLIIPTKNDKEEDLREMARFIRDELGERTPWHVSAFYPVYQMMDLPRTSKEILFKAREIGMEQGLKYVYTGNIWVGNGEDTICSKCGKIVIKRNGFEVEVFIEEGRCQGCGEKIEGVWRGSKKSKTQNPKSKLNSNE